MQRLACVVWSGVLALFLASCGPKPGQDITVVIQEQSQRAAGGKVDEALSHLARYERSGSYRQDQATLLQAMIRIEIGAKRRQSAQARFEEAARRSPALARPSMGLIEDDLMASGQVDDLLGWCARIQGFGFDDSAFCQLADIQCRALDQAGRQRDIPGIFSGCLARMSPRGALNLAAGYGGSLIKARKWETAESILAKLETILPDTPDRQAVVVNARVDLVLARDGYRQGIAYVSGLLASARDEVAARNVGVTGRAAMDAGDAVAAEPLFELALGLAPERILTREEAARGWVRAAAARKSFPDLLARLEQLQKQPGFAPEFVLGLLDQHYLAMLEQGDAVLKTRLYRFCETLLLGKLPAGERMFLGGIMLDIAFLQGDFQKALHLVESGAVDFKEDLRRKMIAKIHAHVEMKNGNVREAIRYLREFMGYVAQTEQEELDPINHVRVSREMILGLNAKRIGDLLLSAGADGEAGKAFAEARDYYSKALTRYPDETSLENRKIRREMAAIPAP